MARAERTLPTVTDFCQNLEVLKSYFDQSLNFSFYRFSRQKTAEIETNNENGENLDVSPGT